MSQPLPMLRTHPTPNPDSLKITDEAGRSFLAAGLKSFRSAAQAEGDALGTALFAIPGVADVLILPSFLTITAQPGADWDALWPRANAVIEAHLAASAA